MAEVPFPVTPKADASCPRLKVKHLVTVPQASEIVLFELFWNVDLDCAECCTIHKVERLSAPSAFHTGTSEACLSVGGCLIPTFRKRSGFILDFTTMLTHCHFQQGQFPCWKKSFPWVKSQQLHLLNHIIKKWPVYSHSSSEKVMSALSLSVWDD